MALCALGVADAKGGDERDWRRFARVAATRDLDHRWNVVREDPQTAASLVQGDVVGHEPENGASALGLQRILGLGSYETAWLWLYKLRPATVGSGRDRLTGCVEVDKTYVGGPEEDRAKKHTRNRSCRSPSRCIRPKRFGSVRMHRVGDCSEGNLTPFVQGAVETGAVVMTDGWKGYPSPRLTKSGYIHHPKISASGNPTHVVMPGVHRVAALLKRWLLGTHQGSVSAKHLDYYLDESVFRFNHRTSTHRGQLFFRLMQQAVAIEPTTFADIVGRCDPTEGLGGAKWIPPFGRFGRGWLRELPGLFHSHMLLALFASAVRKTALGVITSGPRQVHLMRPWLTLGNLTEKGLLSDIRERLSIFALDGNEYAEALEASAARGIVGGSIYDAILAYYAIKARAETIYSWNTRHYLSCGPEVTRRLRTP